MLEILGAADTGFVKGGVYRWGDTRGVKPC